MGVPILKQGDVLIASIQDALADADLLELQTELAQQAGRHRARGAIIDVTALDVLDSFSCRTLREIVEILRLRGTETVIVGVQPVVAHAMVRLGLTLGSGTSVLDLEEGLAHLRRGARGRPANGG